MKKIHFTEILSWLTLTYEDTDKSPCLRFGQALWNRLASSEHESLMDSMCGGEYDFFYQLDEDKAMELFMENYIDYD